MQTNPHTFAVPAEHHAFHVYHPQECLFQKGDSLTIDPNRTPVVWDFVLARLTADGSVAVRQYILFITDGHSDRTGIGFEGEMLAPVSPEEDEKWGETIWGRARRKPGRNYDVLGVVCSVNHDGVETPCSPATHPRLYERAMI